MIAHELPVPFGHHEQNPRAMPQSKKYSSPGPQIPLQEGTLPNGARVDFGNRKGDVAPSTTNKKRNDKRASASKSRPDSQHKLKESRNITKDATVMPKSEKLGPVKLAESSLPDVDRLTINSVKNKLRSPAASLKKKAGEVTYAGSSFHSSPAAMALPKPSFRASPKAESKDATVVPSACSSSTASSSNTPNASHVSPAANQLAPSSEAEAPKSLKYPVTAYQPTGAGSNPNPNTGFQLYPPGQVHMPPHIQPGFAYHFTPQGYLQYNTPQAMSDQSHIQQLPRAPAPAPYYSQGIPPRPIQGHQGQHMPPQHQMYGGGPQITSFYQQPGYYGFPNPAPAPAFNLGAHKISFNDLLGSAK